MFVLHRYVIWESGKEFYCCCSAAFLYNHQGRARGNATAKPTTNCKQVRLTRKLFSPENPFAQLKMKAKIHLFVHRMHT
jgi:hypothetical protein